MEHILAGSVLKIGIVPKPPFIYPCAVQLAFIPNNIFKQRELMKMHKCARPGADIEFFQAISLILNVNFLLIQPDDVQFDGLLPNGSRKGIVGQLERGEVDLSSRCLW